MKKSKSEERYPGNTEDFSSNWKKLIQTMPNVKKKKKSIKMEEKLRRSKLSEMEKSQKEESIWFDDDSGLFTKADKAESTGRLVKPGSFVGLTKAVGIDCEMVGTGSDGRDNMLARVSIVNQFGNCLYDKYVKPSEDVTDFRTHVSGIRWKDIKNAESFKTVQKEVSDIITGRILVGHAVKNDLRVLYLDHPHRAIRDTSCYKPFRTLFNGRTPSLKNLTETLLKVKVQEGEHDSVQDAQATMRLYTMNKRAWESELKRNLKFKQKRAKQR